MGKRSNSRAAKEKGRSPEEAFRSFDVVKLLQIHPKDVDHLTDEQKEFFLKIREAVGDASAQIRSENYDLIARYVPLWYWKAQELERVVDIILETIKEDCTYIQSGRHHLKTVDWDDGGLHKADEDLELELSHLESTELNSTYLLLAGFAMENVLKGFCILRHPDLIEGANFDRRLITHNLPRIAEKLHLVLSEQESHLLHRLHRAIIWEGRYPIPLEPEEYGKCAKENVTTSALSACYRDAFALGDAPTVFAELFGRLHLDLFLEWTKKVVSGGYDQRTQDFIRDMWSAQRD